MMRPENLFNNTIVFPVESILFRNFPAKAKLINQIHETIIVASVKAHFSFPMYWIEFVPITPIVSKIACGFNNETDAAKGFAF